MPWKQFPYAHYRHILTKSRCQLLLHNLSLYAGYSNEIYTLVFAVKLSSSAMSVLTGSGKSKMPAARLEILISQDSIDIQEAIPMF